MITAVMLSNCALLLGIILSALFDRDDHPDSLNREDLKLLIILTALLIANVMAVIGLNMPLPT